MTVNVFTLVVIRRWAGSGVVEDGTSRWPTETAMGSRAEWHVTSNSASAETMLARPAIEAAAAG